VPFDGLVLAAVRKELENKLTGGRIERIYQPDKEELVVLVHRPGIRHRLLLSANARNARIHLTGISRENPSSPPLFCMVLRKHLEGGRITGIEQPGLERALIIRVDTRDELGSPVQKQLICEIMGKHSNIILVDASTNLIIDGIKRYSHTVSRYREVLPGRLYLPPPAQDKINPLSLDEEKFRQACLGMPLETSLAELLQRRFEGMSTLTCREIVYRANLPLEISLDECGDYELRALWEAFRKVMVLAAENHLEPCLVKGKRGEFIDFAAIEINTVGHNKRFGEMNVLLDDFFADKENLEKLAGEKTSLLTYLDREIMRLEKKLDLYAESLIESAGAEKFKLYGELLTANLHRLKKGAAEAVLENFYEEGGPVVSIPLDPQLTPVQNSQACFKKYLKLKNAREILETRSAQAREELGYLDGVRTAVELATGLSELDEIRKELTGQGYLKPAFARLVAAGGRKERGGSSPVSKPHSFRSSDGLQILVGKNNKQNDYLTLKAARDDDVWLHARGIPGAHVIIKTGGKEVPPATLAEAAALAAYFSKGRHSKNVQVDYTFKKYVYKPRGSRPGTVIYERCKTLTAAPDEETAVRLKESEHDQHDPG